MSTMKAVVISEHGDASVLKVKTDVPKPTLTEDGTALVRNTYAGLNFIDTYFRTGLYKRALPFIAGQEGGGVIEEIRSSDNSDDYELVGDTIVYTGVPGSYAEYSVVPLSKCIKVPDGLALEQAIACTTQGLTAHYLVTDATASLIQPNEWCLIYSVGSGTAQWAVQMAKAKGYKVIGTTSRTKLERVQQLSKAYDELIVLECVEGKSYADYESVDIAARVMEITGGVGCKAVIDGVGASTASISVKCLARRGIWISFGNASGAVPLFSLLQLSPKSAFVTRPKLGDYLASPEEIQRRCSEVFGWVQDGTLQVHVDQIIPLEEAQKGHEYMESGKSQGKILFQL